MKRIWLGKTLGMAAAIVLVLPTLAAPLSNMGFESGTFGGWALAVPRGNSQNSPRSRAAGTAGIVSSWGSQVGLTNRPAAGGNYYALLGSLADGYFHGNQTFNITLSRQIELGEGDMLSGWAFFYNGDYIQQDCASVKIYNHDGDLVATPWRECSGGINWCDENSTPFQTATPWTPWHWTAAADGLYTVRFGMSTGGDNCDASYGAFDELLVTPGPIVVPEPASASVLLYGLGVLVAFRRWVRRN